MSMRIQFFRNQSPNNKLDKSLKRVAASEDCIIKEECSIVDPVIIWQSAVSTAKSQLFTRANYCWIPMFRRYYFITGIKVLNAGAVEISCHCDVLTSFKEAIRANPGITARQEKKYNLYLDDGSFQVYQNPLVQSKYFPSGFDTWSYILAVAG